MEMNIECPFSFGLGDELFPLPSLPPMNISELPWENNDDTNLFQQPKDGSRRKQRPTSSSNVNGDESPNEHKKKKSIHRDVERQRRQDMSSLYSTLRSLLPLQYVKGKRSVCDHVHETVNYIQYMQNKIQQLSNRRDELKILSNENRISSTVKMSNSSKKDSVMVRARNESKGVQIVVDTGTQNMNLISNIFQTLVGEGLEILSYISTKVNERYLHTIECHVVVNVDSYRSIDVSKLQHKLMNLEYLHF